MLLQHLMMGLGKAQVDIWVLQMTGTDSGKWFMMEDLSVVLNHVGWEFKLASQVNLDVLEETLSLAKMVMDNQNSQQQGGSP